MTNLSTKDFKLKKLIKRKTNFLALFITLVAINLVSFPTIAGENCYHIIKEILQSFDQQLDKVVDLDQHIGQRLFVANYAKKNGIPVFIKQNQAGEEIPVILVNKTTSGKLKKFIENSYGTEVALQPGYSNDHGLLRTGNAIIDVDAPGYRGYGEIHNTGLAWKDFNSYTTRRTTQSGVILEVSYLVTPEEKKAIDLYQRIRRAAIFRVKFAFKDFKTEDHPFLLATGGEHCFIFCKAQAVTSHISELSNKLYSLGVKNPDDYFAKPEVIEKLSAIKNLILSTASKDLSPELINKQEIIKSFEGLYPETVKTSEQKAEFIRWALSYDGSKNYNRVLKDLGVTSDYGVGDARNKRVSAILVYDENANLENFNKGIYSTKGAFTSWPTGAQKAVE